MITLSVVKPKDIATICGWSLNTRDSYFLLHSVLPVTPDDLALELGSLQTELRLVSYKQKPVGLIRTTNIEQTRGVLSMTMHPSQNNTKVMHDALEQYLQIIFTRHAQLQTVYVHCLSHELEYKKVLLELLFTAQGTLKEHLFINGKYLSVEVLGLQRKEYFK